MLRANSRNVFVLVIWLIAALNFVYFVRRSFLADYCNVDHLLKASARSGSASTSGQKQPEAASAETEVDDTEFVGCERDVDNVSTGAVDGETRRVTQKRPWCVYTDEVDLRIIVLTYKRQASLLKLLNSINDLELDGAKVSVEIWIDCDKKTNKTDEPTVSAARSFRWRHGPVRVHVRRRHAGIYGQWIDTWRPRSASTTEMALILEDDLSLSPFAYRWLRAARRFYADRRPDVAGLTLQSETLIVAANGSPLSRPSAAETGPAFLYGLVGSWGFAPSPAVWLAFQDWYADVLGRPGPPYSPLVDGVIMTKWYTDMERRGKADTMWTMWFIHYCAVVRRLYTVYSNIPSAATDAAKRRLTSGGKNATMHGVNGGCLAVNRREPGLHFGGKPANNTKLLLMAWDDAFVRFHEDVVVLGLSGKPVVTSKNRTKRSRSSKLV